MIKLYRDTSCLVKRAQETLDEGQATLFTVRDEVRRAGDNLEIAMLVACLAAVAALAALVLVLREGLRGDE